MQLCPAIFPHLEPDAKLGIGDTYLGEGSAEGFVLASVSSLLTIAAARLINDQLSDGLFRLQFLDTTSLLAFVAASGLLGLLGAWIAVATLPRKWLL